MIGGHESGAVSLASDGRAPACARGALHEAGGEACAWSADRVPVARACVSTGGGAAHGKPAAQWEAMPMIDGFWIEVVWAVGVGLFVLALIYVS